MVSNGRVSIGVHVSKITQVRSYIMHSFTPCKKGHDKYIEIHHVMHSFTFLLSHILVVQFSGARKHIQSMRDDSTKNGHSGSIYSQGCAQLSTTHARSSNILLHLSGTMSFSQVDNTFPIVCVY